MQIHSILSHCNSSVVTVREERLFSMVKGMARLRQLTHVKIGHLKNQPSYKLNT